MKKLPIKGHTDKERIESLAGIVERMQRFSGTQKIGVAPPVVPLSCSHDNPLSGDMLLRYFFPFKGHISKVLSKMVGARKVSIDISLTSIDSGRVKTVEFGDGVRETAVSIEVLPGDLLEISFNNSEQATGDLELHLSAVIDVVLSPKQITNIAIDQLGLGDPE